MKKNILNLTIIMLTLFIGIKTVTAASFSATVGSKNLSKGNTTKLTIKGSDVTGRFNIKTSNASVISISEDRVWIENNSHTITLTALSVGTSTITITPINTSDGNGNAVNLESKSIKITVSLPKEKSTDNTLSNLSVEGYEISPAFNKDTLDYSVNVPEGTKSVKVNAKATSKYANVSGIGTKDVIEGVNNLIVVVKAENGSERIYNLVVNVIDQNPINIKVDDKEYTLIKLRENYTCPKFFSESETVINNLSIPSCTNEKINYTLVGLKNADGLVESFIYQEGKYTKYVEIVSSSIQVINEKYDGVIDGLTETKLNIDGIDYHAFRFSPNSNYYVLYGVNVENGTKGLYVYDKINKTLSGYDTEYIEYLKNKNQIYIYVIIAFGCGLFLSIICIFMLNKNKKVKVNDKENHENDKHSKKEKKKKENIKDSKEVNNNIEEKKEENSIIEKNVEKEKIDNEDNTETYYLFENDKKRRKKVKK